MHKRSSGFIHIILLLVVLVALGGILVFWFLNSNKSQSTDNGANNKIVRIGFSLATLQEERWQKDIDLFTAKTKTLGGQVIVENANGDAKLQVTQGENLITQKVDVLVVVPVDGEAASAIVDDANKAGIRVIAYDRMIKNSKLDYYVSFDNDKVGQFQAQGIVAVKSSGNFAYVGGSPTDNNATLLRTGSLKILQPKIDSGAIKLVVNQLTPGWDPGEAYKTVKTYLATGGTLDAVVAANDGTAGGVVQALKEAGLAGKVPVSGQDADLAACQRIVQGLQTMTVYKPIKSLAEKVAEMSIAIAKGEKVTTNNSVNNGKIDVPSFLLEPVLVTKDNMNDTVIKDGFHTLNEVYQSSSAK